MELQPKPAKFKNDWLDAISDSFRSASHIHAIVFYIPAFFIGTAAVALSGSESDLLTISAGSGLVGELSSLLISLAKKRNFSDSTRLNNFFDSCIIHPSVYKGSRKLYFTRGEISPGDNFLYLSLPDIKGGVSTDAQRQALSRLVDLTLGLTVKQVKGIDYQYIAYSPYYIDRNTRLDINLEDLFAKRTKFIDPKQNVAFVRAKSINLKEYPTPFEQAVEITQDRKLRRLVELYRSSSGQEREDFASEIKSRVVQNFRTAVSVEYGGAELRYEMNGTNILRKKRHFTYSDLVGREKKQILTITEGGDLKQQKIETLLQVPDGLMYRDQIKSIVSERNPRLRKLRAGYFLNRFVSTISLGFLLDQDSHSKKEIINDIKESGLYYIGSNGENFLASRIRRGYSDVLALINFKDRALALGLGIFLVNALLFSGDYINSLLPKPTFSPSTNPDVNPTQPLWRITSQGGMSKQGYYIETVKGFENNHGWTDGAGKVIDNLPKASEVEGKLILERRMAVGERGLSFKIPIREQTRVGALRIKNAAKEDIDYQALIMPDGTVQIFISFGQTGGKDWVDVSAELVPSGLAEGAKAVYQVSVGDVKELSLDALRIVNKSSLAPNQVLGNDSVVAMVANSHIYTHNPSLKEQVVGIKQAAEFVNKGVEDSRCDCEVCNVTTTLLSGYLDGTNKLNLAEGFINSANLTGSGGDNDFLQSGELHAFGIDAFGFIYDATPAVLGTDPETQRYLETMKLKSIDPEKFWAQETLSIQNQAESKFRDREFQRLIFILAEGTLSLLTARAALRLTSKIKIDFKGILQRFKRRYPPGRVIDPIIDLDLNDSKRVFNFISWLSYGGKTPLNINLEIPKNGKVIDPFYMKELIRSNFDPQKLRRYINKGFTEDDHFSLTDKDRLNIRSVVWNLLALKRSH